MKFLKRHLWSVILCFLALLVVISWYRSSRVWVSHRVHLPFLRCTVFSESSEVFVVVGFPQHPEPNVWQTETEDITGDVMKFVWKFPRVVKMQGSGSTQFYMPHWQIVSLLLLSAGGVFWFERRRILQNLSEK